MATGCPSGWASAVDTGGVGPIAAGTQNEADPGWFTMAEFRTAYGYCDATTWLIIVVVERNAVAGERRQRRDSLTAWTGDDSGGDGGSR